MTLEELNNLDPANIGNWPWAAKLLVIALLVAAALGAGYYFDTQSQLERIEKAKQQEVEKRTEFEKKQKQAARLPQLKAQLVEIQNTLSDLKRSLPSKAEVDKLIQDISQTAIASGLKVRRFEPKPEQPGSGYVAQPITLRLSGAYHSFGKFIGGVAAMPRIVTQEEISIKVDTKRGQGANASTDPLVMELVAKIYYIQDEESIVSTDKPTANKPAAPAAKK